MTTPAEATLAKFQTLQQMLADVAPSQDPVRLHATICIVAQWLTAEIEAALPMAELVE